MRKWGTTPEGRKTIGGLTVLAATIGFALRAAPLVFDDLPHEVRDRVEKKLELVKSRPHRPPLLRDLFEDHEDRDEFEEEDGEVEPEQPDKKEEVTPENTAGGCMRGFCGWYYRMYPQEPTVIVIGKKAQSQNKTPRIGPKSTSGKKWKKNGSLRILESKRAEKIPQPPLANTESSRSTLEQTIALAHQNHAFTRIQRERFLQAFLRLSSRSELLRLMNDLGMKCDPFLNALSVLINTSGDGSEAWEKKLKELGYKKNADFAGAWVLDEDTPLCE